MFMYLCILFLKRIILLSRIYSKFDTRFVTKCYIRSVKDHTMEITHVHVLFFPSRHNFRDIELKFCMFSKPLFSHQILKL